MAGEAIHLPLFDDEPVKPTKKGTTSLEEVLQHVDDFRGNFQPIEVDPPTQRGAREADGGRIQVATRKTQHHDKNVHETPIVVPAEESKQKQKTFWWQKD